MTYNKEDLEQKALKVIKQHKIKFVKHLASFLPCSRSTYYELELDKSDTLKDAIDANRESSKVQTLNRWEKSENATLQVAYMKLIADDDEAHRLNGSKTETSGVLNVNHSIDAETLKAINEAYDSIS